MILRTGKMNAELKLRFKNALEVDPPEDDLETIVLDLKKEGKTQREIYDLFMEAFGYYRDHGTEKQYDDLADIMDRIVGWGCQGSWFFKTSLDT